MEPTNLPIPADAPCSSEYRPTTQDIRRHMHLVYKVVGQMQRKLPRSVQRDDLVSAGTLGLFSALLRSEGDVASPSFECYASIRIRGAILDELRKLDWSPRRRKVASTGESTSSSQAAVNVVRFDDLPNLHEPTATTGCPERAHAASDVRIAVSRAMTSLSDRERQIVELRYFEEVPSKEIAVKLGVSEARVSQLHSRATDSLRRSLSEHDPRNTTMPSKRPSAPPPSTFPTPPSSMRRLKAERPVAAEIDASLVEYRKAA